MLTTMSELQGLVGLRPVAERMGAICEPNEKHPDSGYIVSEKHRYLPNLLADYLLTLHQIREAG